MEISPNSWIDANKGVCSVPTYDYECGACQERFEIFHSMRETRKKCPSCGAQRLTRLIGPGSGFLFRGSGFYITDYRSSDYKAKAKSETSTSTSSPAAGSSAPAAKSDGEKKAPAKEKSAS
jgi:putative FmdB family regulatory protein